MIVGESIWRRWRTFRNFTPEEEVYLRMTLNPVWPFEDLGNGFYYIQIYSDKIILAWFFMSVSVIFMLYFVIEAGIFAMPVTLITLIFLFGASMLYGNCSMRELIINSEYGYLLRMQTTEKILVEQTIRNLYIRLQEKIDTVGVYWYCIILGGYCLDDIQLSQMSNNREAMRKFARRLAKHMGINFFDVEDTTPLHKIYHFRDRSTLVREKDPIFNILMTNNAEDFKLIPAQYNLNTRKISIAKSNEDVLAALEKKKII